MNNQIITTTEQIHDLLPGGFGFTCNDASFDLAQHFLDVAESYGVTLTAADIDSIEDDLVEHGNSEHRYFSHIKYAQCTNSNEYEIGLNEETCFLAGGTYQFYILTFRNSDVVLYLENSYR